MPWLSKTGSSSHNAPKTSFTKCNASPAPPHICIWSSQRVYLVVLSQDWWTTLYRSGPRVTQMLWKGSACGEWFLLLHLHVQLFKESFIILRGLESHTTEAGIASLLCGTPRSSFCPSVCLSLCLYRTLLPSFNKGVSWIESVDVLPSVPSCVAVSAPRQLPGGRAWGGEASGLPLAPDVGTLTSSMRAWVRTEVPRTEQEVTHSEQSFVLCWFFKNQAHPSPRRHLAAPQRPRDPYDPPQALCSRRVSLTCSVESEHPNRGRKFQGNPPVFGPLRN